VALKTSWTPISYCVYKLRFFIDNISRKNTHLEDYLVSNKL